MLCLAFEALIALLFKINCITVSRAFDLLNIKPVSPITWGIPKYSEPIGGHSQSIASHNELGKPSSRDPW